MGRPIRFEDISQLVNWQFAVTEIFVVRVKDWFYLRGGIEFIRARVKQFPDATFWILTSRFEYAQIRIPKL